MCIGTPMRIESGDGYRAEAVRDLPGGDIERCTLDMQIVGAQPAGTWVLAFHGAARQVLSEHEAALARAGRQALAAVLRGDARVDEFFADLVGREPELPAHLRPAAST
jgi:hydrogenase assembly chaperone HypC/HupF